MADTAKRLYGPAQPATTAATIYTVPASTTTVVRNIRVSNTTGTAATITMSIGTNAAAAQIMSAVSVPANSVYDWSGFLVMNAADILQALQGTSSALTVTVSGIEVA